MPLRGWKRLAGSAERYRNPAGKTVSRRQYENARARSFGWKSWSEYQRARLTTEYNQGRTDAIIERGLSVRTTGMGSEYGRLYARMIKARATDAPDLYDPDGPLAEWLVYIGRREPDWNWPPGDTDEFI